MEPISDKEFLEWVKWEFEILLSKVPVTPYVGMVVASLTDKWKLLNGGLDRRELREWLENKIANGLNLWKIIDILKAYKSQLDWWKDDEAGGYFSNESNKKALAELMEFLEVILNSITTKAQLIQALK